MESLLEYMEAAFSKAYVPPRLLIREPQAYSLLAGSYPKFVYGPPDVGKTVTARWLAEVAEPDKVEYVLCAKSLRASLAPKLGALRANGDDAATQYFEKVHGKVIIFDDIQHLTRNRKAELSDTLNTFYNQFAEIKIVLMTNWLRAQFTGCLDEDTKSRYRRCEWIVFERYTLDEVKAILRQRSEIAGIQIESSAIAHLAARYVADGWQLREEFRILESLAPDQPVTDEKLTRALTGELTLDFAKDFRALSLRSLRQAVILGAVAKLQVETVSNLAGGVASAVPAPRVYETFLGAWRSTGAVEVGVDTFNGDLDALEGMGYVRLETHVNERGKPNYVCCTANPQNVLRGFKSWVEASQPFRISGPVS